MQTLGSFSSSLYCCTNVNVHYIFILTMRYFMSNERICYAIANFKSLSFPRSQKVYGYYSVFAGLYSINRFIFLQIHVRSNWTAWVEIFKKFRIWNYFNKKVVCVFSFDHSDNSSNKNHFQVWLWSFPTKSRHFDKKGKTLNADEYTRKKKTFFLCTFY